MTMTNGNEMVRPDFRPVTSNATRPLDATLREATIAKVANANPEASMLRRHLATYVDLMSQRGLVMKDLDGTLRRIDETASLVLDVERVSIGDPQALDPQHLLALPLHLLVDLRSAAVNEHDADADAVQQQHVLGEAARPVGIGHWQAADLHHQGLPGETADVGQRLD